MQEKDLDEVATLHFRSLQEGFVYKLGSRQFMKHIYQTILSDQRSFCYLHDQGKITGVAAATENTAPLFSKLRRLSILPWLLFGLIRKPHLLRDFLQAPQYPNNLPEMIYLFVDSTVHGQGIGSMLIKAVDAEFKQRGVGKYTIVINSSNPARRFYEKHGFMHLKKRKLFGEEKDVFLKVLDG